MCAEQRFKNMPKTSHSFLSLQQNSEAVLYNCAEQRFKKMPKTSHSLSQSLPQHHSFILINAFLRTRCPSRPCSATTSLEKHAPDGNWQHTLFFTPPRAERINSLRHDKNSIQQTNKQHKGSSRPGQGFSNIRPAALGFARFDRW